MGRPGWLACFGMDDRDWNLADADRIGTCPEEPTRCAGPPAGRRLPVPLSGMACRRRRAGGSLADGTALIRQLDWLVSALGFIAQPDEAEHDQQEGRQNGDIAEGGL